MGTNLTVDLAIVDARDPLREPGFRSVAELQAEALGFIGAYPLKERKREWVN